jgi:L-2-hydroxyglutarate oxidase
MWAIHSQPMTFCETIMGQYDYAIIGGGIVGLATAYQLLARRRQARVLLLEKEPRLAIHQTGHNSGVLHSGIYYRPDSLKARTCRQGKKLMQAFCERESIPFEICGKVIVATAERELPTLQMLHERGQANGVKCEIIDRVRLQELEPFAAGVSAIQVPEAGILNYRAVCEALFRQITAEGACVEFDAQVTNLFHDTGDGLVRIVTQDGREYFAKQVVACAGLHSDRLARATGTEPGVRIVPFRGEYYRLKPQAERLCRNLIYPVPNPDFPFLGVHFTRMIEGGVECGPNAVLALSREGYRWRDANLRDVAETLSYPGFLRLAKRYWRTGLGEVVRSLSKRAFVTALQRLVPEITSSDLEPAPAGVRAQAVTANGQLLDDFALVESPQVLHVCNAPSPAATASLEIGRTIVEKLIGSRAG